MATVIRAIDLLNMIADEELKNGTRLNIVCENNNDVYEVYYDKNERTFDRCLKYVKDDFYFHFGGLHINDKIELLDEEDMISYSKYKELKQKLSDNKKIANKAIKIINNTLTSSTMSTEVLSKLNSVCDELRIIGGDKKND